MRRAPVRFVHLPGLGRRANVAALNSVSLPLAAHLRPDVVLSGHCVTSPAAALIQRAFKIPYLQYVYAKEIAERPRLASFAVQHAARTIAISSHARDLALKAGADSESIRVVHPGVDQRRSQRQDDAAAGRRSEIVTVARLEDDYKGFDVVLRALPLIRSRVPDARWTVLGDGPLRKHLEETAASWGLSEAVRFLGRVTDEERDRALSEAAVFTMPSRLPANGGGEGFGIVYLEAGLHGLPVVAGNLGGAVDAVRDTETGLLVDARDHVAVANALVALLQDPERARTMGAAGRRQAERFTWTRMANEVNAVVEDVVRGRIRQRV
jgi:phosphatidyl-myo-inositol dimannoside synthase